MEQQHDYRLSLTLTRRVVRRLLELDSALSQVAVWQPAVPVTNVPDPASFLCSLRVLRRVVRRMIAQATPQAAY